MLVLACKDKDFPALVVFAVSLCFVCSLTISKEAIQIGDKDF